jgi:Tfp pilus assembly protein PilO
MTSYKRLFHQYQHLAVSVGIFIVIIVGVMAGLYPAVVSITSMRSSTAKITDELNVLREKVSLLESVDEITYRSYLTDLALAVPTDKSLTSLFSTIDGLSQSTGVTFSNFTLVKPGSIATESAKKQSNEERKVGSNFLPFTLTVTGTYEQIRTFVERSITVRRFFRIRSFSILFTTAEVISVEMGMDAYYAPLPTNLGSSQQAISPLSPQDEATISRIASLPVLGREDSGVSDESGSVETTPREDPFSL